MLDTNLINFIFIKHIKSGVYIDYIWRLVAKTSILNLFIWGGLYVSEKLIIEYLTRFINNNNTWRFSAPKLTIIWVLQVVSKWVFLLTTLMFLI